MMRPPMINASATGTGRKRYCLMKPPNKSPSTAAGMKATSRFLHSFGSMRKNRARYSHTTASIAPVWITTSKTLSRSPLAPSRSLTRMRCPVLEIGRNSVIPSTTPRINALMTSVPMRIEERLDAVPVRLLSVGVVMARALERDPALRTRPRIEEAFCVLGRNHFVARCNQAKERRADSRRKASRIEPMPEHPADRQIRVIALRHFDEAVVGRNEHHACYWPLGSEAYGDA